MSPDSGWLVPCSSGPGFDSTSPHLRRSIVGLLLDLLLKEFSFSSCTQACTLRRALTLLEGVVYCSSHDERIKLKCNIEAFCCCTTHDKRVRLWILYLNSINCCSFNSHDEKNNVFIKPIGHVGLFMILGDIELLIMQLTDLISRLAEWRCWRHWHVMWLGTCQFRDWGLQ